MNASESCQRRAAPTQSRRLYQPGWRRLPVRCLVALIHLYRVTLSPFIGNQCRFYPSCSRYAEQALIDHGLWRGLWLAAARLCRCHPFNPGGPDPVPPARRPS